MKSRAEALKEKRAKREAAEAKFDGERPVYVGTKCAVPDCGFLQFESPGGVTCANGHGGADGVPIEGQEELAKKPPPAPESSAHAVKPRPFEFPNANKAKEAGLREDLQRVVETIFVDDVHAEWKLLEKALEIGEKRSEHAHVMVALDKQGRWADRAFRLYLTAKLAREKWEAENETTWSGMWGEATRSLQHEKDTGLRSKQITDADVKARVAALYPDQYRDQEERRRALEFTVKALERLADIHLGRMRNVEAIAGRQRG